MKKEQCDHLSTYCACAVSSIAENAEANEVRKIVEWLKSHEGWNYEGECEKWADEIERRFLNQQSGDEKDA